MRRSYVALFALACAHCGASPETETPPASPPAPALSDATAVVACESAPPAFLGIKSVSASGTRLRIDWDAAKDETTPTNKIVYRVYGSRSQSDVFRGVLITTTPAG